MGSTVLQNHPIPDLVDAANVPSSMEALGESLEKYTVMRFASTAARDATVTSPEEGMVAVTLDTTTVWLYDGASWVPLNGPWIDTVSVLTGWTETNAVRYQRRGNIVTVVGRLTNSSGGDLDNTDPAFNLPAGFRPAADLGFALPRAQSTPTLDLWAIETGGNVRPGFGVTIPDTTAVMFNAGFSFPVD